MFDFFIFLTSLSGTGKNIMHFFLIPHPPILPQIIVSCHQVVLVSLTGELNAVDGLWAFYLSLVFWRLYVELSVREALFSFAKTSRSEGF